VVKGAFQKSLPAAISSAESKWPLVMPTHVTAQQALDWGFSGVMLRDS
jgi:hypothetical protein